MTIHKEGYRTIILTLVIAISLSLIITFLFPDQILLRYAYNIFAVIISLLIISFFRYPDRKVTLNDKKIISPADGTIVVIEEVMENEYLNEKCKQVSIFMSPLNVHANWYPVAGKIKFVKYHEGNYFVAFHPKSSTENERTTVVIETKDKRTYLLRQIAGAMARRIVCYGKQDQIISQGSQMGFIKFGSRVDLFLPLDARINVHLKQKVRGQKTVIAEIP